jgi:hypothetical protein
VKRSTRSNPNIATLAERSGPGPQCERSDKADSLATNSKSFTGKLGAALKGLLSVLVGVALVPIAILLVQLWQTTVPVRWDGKTTANNPMEMPSGTGLEQSVKSPSAIEVVLSSPDTIQVKAGNEIYFHLAIDATDALPSRSIIAVSGLPHGASFSEGRPYGATGWSLRPDEIGDLRLRLPSAPNGTSDLRIELLAADGAVLAQSETRLSIATDLAEEKTLRALSDSPFDQIAASAFIEPIPPMPSRKPARNKPSVDVRTVKVVTIKPPKPSRPHDGAYALGEVVEVPAKWVEIVRAVDMHARAEQSSETVKVVEKGLKMRVTGRDKNWVQVSDPATSSNGWIYSRFLKPTEPPEQ